MKNIPRLIRHDSGGICWKVNMYESTCYPSGGPDKVVFDNADVFIGEKRTVRYDEAGRFIAGDMSLA